MSSPPRSSCTSSPLGLGGLLVSAALAYLAVFIAFFVSVSARRSCPRRLAWRGSRRPGRWLGGALVARAHGACGRAPVGEPRHPVAAGARHHLGQVGVDPLGREAHLGAEGLERLEVEHAGRHERALVVGRRAAEVVPHHEAVRAARGHVERQRLVVVALLLGEAPGHLLAAHAGEAHEAPVRRGLEHGRVERRAARREHRRIEVAPRAAELHQLALLGPRAPVEGHRRHHRERAALGVLAHPGREAALEGHAAAHLGRERGERIVVVVGPRLAWSARAARVARPVSRVSKGSRRARVADHQLFAHGLAARLGRRGARARARARARRRARGLGGAALPVEDAARRQRDHHEHDRGDARPPIGGGIVSLRARRGSPLAHAHAWARARHALLLARTPPSGKRGPRLSPRSRPDHRPARAPALW
jgi:hypothetical protein